MAKTNARRWDALGIILSVACVIHCLALPLIATSIPALAASHAEDQAFHAIMAVLAVLVGATTFIPGWRRHRVNWVPLIGVLGIGALIAGSLTPCDHGAELASSSCCPGDHGHGGHAHEHGSDWLGAFHTAVTPIGCALLIGAHFFNHRFGHRCSDHA